MEKKSINVEKCYDDTESVPGGTFYVSVSIKVDTIHIFDLHGMSTGCGIMQLKGFYNLKKLNDEQLEKLKEYLVEYFTDEEINYKSTKVGVIVGTIGNNQMNDGTVELAEKVGFEKVSEYSNWYDRGDGSWRQSLYILKPKFRKLENK